MSQEQLHPSVEEFAQIYQERENLQERLADSPAVLIDLLQAGIDSANGRLHDLAATPEVAEHYRKIGAEVLRAADELSQLEPTLRALGLDEQIAAKRAEINTQLTSAEMKAAQYFVQLSGVEITAPPAPAEDLEPNSAQAPTMPAPSEAGERGKQTLKVQVDPNDNLAINSKVVSLNRDLKVAGKVGAEAAGRHLRVDVLKFLAANPDEEFKASEIWAAIRPDEQFDRNMWNLYCTDFFREELEFRRKPIVTVDKVHPRLLHYSLRNFDLEITDTERILTPPNETVYTLPDGREVAGSAGRTLNLLARATATEPLTTKVALARILNVEELASADQRNVLSSLVSVANAYIEGTNLEIMRVASGERYPGTNRPIPAYYMVERNTASVSTDGASAGETDMPQGDGEFTLHEAAILAGFLTHYNEKLVAHGLEPMPDSIFNDLNEKVMATYTNGEKTDEDLQQLRIRAFDKAQALLSDPDELEEVVSRLETNQDPRYDLIVQLLSYADDEKIALIKKLLSAETSLRVTFDAGRRQGYALVEVASEIVDADGHNI